jgi:hypothetical protein
VQGDLPQSGPWAATPQISIVLNLLLSAEEPTTAALCSGAYPVTRCQALHLRPHFSDHTRQLIARDEGQRRLVLVLALYTCQQQQQQQREQQQRQQQREQLLVTSAYSNSTGAGTGQLLLLKLLQVGEPSGHACMVISCGISAVGNTAGRWLLVVREGLGRGGTLIMRASGKFSPAAATRMRTCPGFMAGSGTSSARRSTPCPRGLQGSPNASQTMARITYSIAGYAKERKRADVANNAG